MHTIQYNKIHYIVSENITNAVPTLLATSNLNF